MNNGTTSPGSSVAIEAGIQTAVLLIRRKGPLASGKVAGVQNLDARLMVSVERRHCARTPGV